MPMTTQSPLPALGAVRRMTSIAPSIVGAVCAVSVLVASAVADQTDPTGALVAALLLSTCAIGFTVAPVLPHWSSFSDSFTGAHPAPHVTGFSWFAAAFEIGSGLYLGIAAVVTMRRARSV